MIITENNEIISSENQNEAQSAESDSKGATTLQNREDITIPVKFNKEIKKLTVEEATVLAQKGMKYDLICDDYKALRELSRKNGKSVSEFLAELNSDCYSKRLNQLTEKCGGDKAMAEHIIELEDSGEDGGENGFGELQKYFPEIHSPEDLPQEITESAKLKGSLLLDEYLRYLLAEKRQSEETAKKQRTGENASIGSQLNRKGIISPEASEFLKGLWK